MLSVYHVKWVFNVRPALLVPLLNVTKQHICRAFCLNSKVNHQWYKGRIPCSQVEHLFLSQ